MARVNITIPDDLLNNARASGLNISRLAGQAVEQELDRRAKLTALDAYLVELERESGPTTDRERAAATLWVDQILGERSSDQHSGTTRSA